MIELALSPLELETERRALLDLMESIKADSFRRLDALGRMIDSRDRALETNAPRDWIEAAKRAQEVIEHSRVLDAEFDAGCRLKELAMRQAELKLK